MRSNVSVAGNTLPESIFALPFLAGKLVGAAELNSSKQVVSAF
jgi:hypothetical protein